MFEALTNDLLRSAAAQLQGDYDARVWGLRNGGWDSDPSGRANRVIEVINIEIAMDTIKQELTRRDNEPWQAER